MVAVVGVSRGCCGGGDREVRGVGRASERRTAWSEPYEPPRKGLRISKQPGQPAHTLSHPATIILRVARHHTFLRTAQLPASAPLFAATIARAGPSRPPHPHSDHQRAPGLPASLCALPRGPPATSRPIITRKARWTAAHIAITRYDAWPTRSSTATCEHHHGAPRSRERRSRARTLHTRRPWRILPPSWRLSCPSPWRSPGGLWATPRTPPTTWMT